MKGPKMSYVMGRITLYGWALYRVSSEHSQCNPYLIFQFKTTAKSKNTIPALIISHSTCQISIHIFFDCIPKHIPYSLKRWITHSANNSSCTVRSSNNMTDRAFGILQNQLWNPNCFTALMIRKWSWPGTRLCTCDRHKIRIREFLFSWKAEWEYRSS